MLNKLNKDSIESQKGIIGFFQRTRTDLNKWRENSNTRSPSALPMLNIWLKIPFKTMN